MILSKGSLIIESFFHNSALKSSFFLIIFWLEEFSKSSIPLWIINSLYKSRFWINSFFDFSLKVSGFLPNKLCILLFVAFWNISIISSLEMFLTLSYISWLFPCAKGVTLSTYLGLTLPVFISSSLLPSTLKYSSWKEFVCSCISTNKSLYIVSFFVKSLLNLPNFISLITISETVLFNLFATPCNSLSSKLLPQERTRKLVRKTKSKLINIAITYNINGVPVKNKIVKKILFIRFVFWLYSSLYNCQSSSLLLRASTAVLYSAALISPWLNKFFCFIHSSFETFQSFSFSSNSSADAYPGIFNFGNLSLHSLTFGLSPITYSWKNSGWLISLIVVFPSSIQIAFISSIW